jgi:uncharacterized protein (DUF362 family)
MHPCTRRHFLARSAAGAGALALGADRLAGVAAAQSAPAAPDAQAAMAIARWSDPQAAAEQMKAVAVKLTEQALAGIGGMGRFVGRGDVVWVKPNIAFDRTPEQAGCTNPDVLATVVRLCFEAGAKVVKVGDNPVHTAQRTYETSGIAAAAKAAGAQVVFLDPSRFKEVDIKGERARMVPVYPEILDADLVVNVPIAKHHVLATVTVGMKNYMGVIDNRRVFHQALSECITDLTRYMKPRLTVLDAVRVLTDHGPTGGRLEDVATRLTVAAGTDIVAIDALGTELLGRKPEDIGTVTLGEKAGLGTRDYRSLKPKEIAVS